MSTSGIKSRIRAAMSKAIRQHRGPQTWKLSHEQLERYRKYQQDQEKFIQSYGHGKYYSAVISGKHIDGIINTTRRAIAKPRLDNDIKEILFTDSVPRITKDMTEDEAAEIYTKLLNRDYQ